MSAPQYPGEPPQTLSERLEIVARRKSVAILTFLIVVAIVGSFVVGLPPLYRASASVLVEGRVPDAFVQSVGGELDSRLQAIKQEALSRARLTELLDRFHLYPELRGNVPTQF